MFDYKIIFFIIPLVIIVLLAYREINNLKQNISEINTEIKQQSVSISSNVNQCVDRIEKISKLHISELQNINKINSQRVNKVNNMCIESDNETEGLSRNYISPECENQNHCITTDNKDIAVQNKDLYLSESLKIPIYVPDDVLYDDLDDDNSNDDNNSSEDNKNDDCDDDENTNSVDVHAPTVENIMKPTQDGGNLLRSVLGLISMNDITNSFANTNTRPIIEPVSENTNDSQQKSSEVNEQNDITEIEDSNESQHSSGSIKSEHSNASTTTSKSERSNTSSSSKKSIKSIRSEKSERSNVSIQSQKDMKCNNIIQKPVDDYTLQELKLIAKENGINITVKTDGKMRQYKKAELYDVLKNFKK